MANNIFTVSPEWNDVSTIKNVVYDKLTNMAVQELTDLEDREFKAMSIPININQFPPPISTTVTSPSLTSSTISWPARNTRNAHITNTVTLQDEYARWMKDQEYKLKNSYFQDSFERDYEKKYYGKPIFRLTDNTTKYAYPSIEISLTAEDRIYHANISTDCLYYADFTVPVDAAINQLLSMAGMIIHESEYPKFLYEQIQAIVDRHKPLPVSKPVPKLIPEHPAQLELF